MYPILYRKKTRTSFLIGLLLFSVTIRLFCSPEIRSAVLQKARSVLESEPLLKAAFLLETGTIPEFIPRSVQVSAPSAAESVPLSSAVPDDGSNREPPSAAPGGISADEPQATAEETGTAPRSDDPFLPGFSPAEAEAIRFRGNCTYAVDKAALLLRPLDWPDAPGPKILIIHSHSCEAYTPSEGHTYLPSANFRTLDLSCNMIAVGDALAEALGDLGLEVIHDRTLNDYPSYNRSYAVAREKIQAYLEEYPSLVMVIDLHRDALDKPVRETVERDGKVLAPLMLVIGTDEGGLSHPHWDRNLSCGLKLQALGSRDSPSLFKSISFRASRFNGDLTPGSLIVEVGSTENTLEEAVASMSYLARYIEELLRCP